MAPFEEQPRQRRHNQGEERKHTSCPVNTESFVHLYSEERESSAKDKAERSIGCEGGGAQFWSIYVELVEHRRELGLVSGFKMKERGTILQIL